MATTTITVPCPTAQLQQLLYLTDPQEKLSLQVIEDFWLYFRNYDPVGASFGNPPPIGNIGLWAMRWKYRDEYSMGIGPIFHILAQQPNAQLLFISNDKSEAAFVVDKTGNRFSIAKAVFGGDDFQQSAWDLLFEEANNRRYYGRMTAIFLYSC